MTDPSHRPELVINHSPQLDLRIALVSVRDYEGNARPDYRMEMHCRLRHSGGEFTYSADNLYFDLDAFAEFSSELQKLQQGSAEQASLKSRGEMVVLKLKGNSRALRATLNIREYLAPTMATFDAEFEVDYDLFVNQLRAEVDRFVDELGAMQSSA